MRPRRGRVRRQQEQQRPRRGESERSSGPERSREGKQRPAVRSDEANCERERGRARRRTSVQIWLKRLIKHKCLCCALLDVDFMGILGQMECVQSVIRNTYKDNKMVVE